MTTTQCRAAEALLEKYLADPGAHRADLRAALDHIGSCADCSARAARLVRATADLGDDIADEDMLGFAEGRHGAEPPRYPEPDLSFLPAPSIPAPERGLAGTAGAAASAAKGLAAQWAGELREAVRGPRFASAAARLAWASFAPSGAGAAVRVVVDNLGRSVAAELTRRPAVDAAGAVSLAIRMDASALAGVPSPFELDVLYLPAAIYDPAAAIIHREAVDDAGRGRLLSTWGLEIASPLPEGVALAAALARRAPGVDLVLDAAAFAFLVSWPDPPEPPVPADPPETGAPGGGT